MNEKQAKVAEQARARWAAADPAPKDHPYLLRKGITDPLYLRASGDTLFVPMYLIDMDKPASMELVNLQKIKPDGEKRFLTGGTATNVRVPLGVEHLRRREDGSFEPGQTLYICEGWATGWTIAHVRKAAVLVGFHVTNLKHVVKYVAVHYASRGLSLVVAADNDRFSGQAGVDVARKAVLNYGRVAIPDFAEPGTSKADGKTDYNDLWLAEGPEPVIYWLNPDNASKANTKPPDYQQPEPEFDASWPTDDGQVPPDDEKPKKKPDTWLETKKFRILGHNHGTYYFLPEGAGQTVGLTPPALERVSNLCRLQNMAWWEHYFAHGKGVDTKAAVDALLQVAHSVGVYRADNLRGRGCWTDETEDGERSLVLHLGDRMVVPEAKRFISPVEYVSPGGYLYQNEGRLNGPAKEPMSLDESKDVLDLIRSLLWTNDIAPDLLAGWVCLAPICGALGWRPHIWLTGERGSGKSTVLSEVVVPLLGGTVETRGMSLYVVGETSEAGIRQRLQADALPVIFDEAEEGEGVGTRIQKVLALARQASSDTDAQTLKGTTHGSSLNYRVRSMFCFASIGGAVYQEADKSRICMLALKGESQVDPEEKIAHWRSIEDRVAEVDAMAGRRLITRTLRMLRDGTLDEAVRVFRRAGGQVFRDQRTGDQYGTLFAGAWLLQSDAAPTEDEARAMMARENVREHQEDQVPEGVKALRIILQQRERVDTTNGPKTIAIGQLVDVAANKGSGGPCTADEATTVLNQIGLRVDIDNGGRILLVANSSEWINKALRNTLYARGVRNVLRGLDGVTQTPNSVRFHGGYVSRASVVPFHLLNGSVG